MSQSFKFASKKPRLIAFVALVTLSLLLVPQPWLSESDRASASGTAIVAGHFLTGREATSAVFDGTHAWVFGGKEGGKRLADIVRYDPNTDEATTIDTKLPGGREATSAVFIDGSAYILGGRNSGDRVSAILKFTPDDNGGGITTIAAKLPTGREFTAAGTDGKHIFVFGGTDGTYLNTIVRIDPVSNEVKTMDAKLPTGRILLSAASAGRFIYLFGGKDGAPIDDVLRYDTKEDQLADFGSLPTARADTSAVFAAPFAYVFGGRDATDGRLNDILRYDPLTQTTTELDWSFRTERESTSAVATGDDGAPAVVFGGRNGGHRLDEIVEVSLDAGAPQNLIARTGSEPGEIDLTWEAPSEGEFTSPILGFRVYRGLASGQRFAVEEFPADQLAFTDAGLPNSVIRYYSITAFTADGEGGHSNEAYAATKRGPPPPLPTPREGTESVWIKGRAFVFGGYQSADAVEAPGTDLTLLENNQEAGGDDGEVPLNEIVEYDPDSGEVTVLGTSLPPKCCATGESDGDVVYLFGGDGGDERCCEGDGDSLVDNAMDLTDPTDTEIYKFDPDTGELTVLGASLPTPVCCTTSAFDGDLIWLFGGSEEERCCEDEEGIAPGDEVSDILFFNPATETIHDSGFDLPVPKCCFTAESEGGYIWLFGGSDDSDERCCEETLDGATDDDIIRFDPDSGEVIILGTSLPIPKCCLSSADDDAGTIYLFGGEGDEERCCEEESTAASAAGLGGVQYDDIYAFDVATQTLRILDDKLPSARADTSAVWNGQRAFIFGGDVDGSSTKEVVGFDPLAPQATTATAGPGRGEITVTWSAPADDAQTSIPGAKYRVYVQPQSGDEFTVEVNVDQTTLIDSDLGDGVTRTYRVSVVTDNDEGPHSRESSARTFTGPSAPRNLQAEQDFLAGTVTLTWDAPASLGGTLLTKYTVYKHTDVAPIEEEINVDPSETTYVDSECRLAAVQCFYTVTATNVVGESGHSNEVSAIGTAVPGDAGFVGPTQPGSGVRTSSEKSLLPVSMTG